MVDFVRTLLQKILWLVSAAATVSWGTSPPGDRCRSPQLFCLGCNWNKMIVCYESTRALHKESTRRGGDTPLGQVVVDGNVCVFVTKEKNKQPSPKMRPSSLQRTIKSHERSLELQKQGRPFEGKCHKPVSQTLGCSHSQHGAAPNWETADVIFGAHLGIGLCRVLELRLAVWPIRSGFLPLSGHHLFMELCPQTAPWEEVPSNRMRTKRQM